MAYRADGTRQAWDDGTCRPFGPDIVATLLAGVGPVADEAERTRITRFNATVVNHLFLLWFDTRSGIADTGPYPLPDGRVLLVREFTKLAQSDFCLVGRGRGLPYRNLTAALVLDGVEMRATDFGTLQDHPRGLPRAPGGVRPVHHRHRRRLAAAGGPRRARRSGDDDPHGAGPPLPGHRRHDRATR